MERSRPNPQQLGIWRARRSRSDLRDVTIGAAQAGRDYGVPPHEPRSLARARSGSASRQSYRAHRDRLPSGRDRRNSHGITLTRRIRLDSVDIRTGPQ